MLLFSGSRGPCSPTAPLALLFWLVSPWFLINTLSHSQEGCLPKPSARGASHTSILHTRTRTHRRRRDEMGHTLNEEPLACEACFQWALSCESSILSLVLSSLLAVFHEESAAVLLVVMYGESDQGLQVLRSAADVCVCVCVFVCWITLSSSWTRLM